MRKKQIDKLALGIVRTVGIRSLNSMPHSQRQTTIRYMTGLLKSVASIENHQSAKDILQNAIEIETHILIGDSMI